MTTMSSSTMSSAELRRSLTLIEVKPGLKFSEAALKEMLPDIETILFFGKLYQLNHVQLSDLLHQLVKTPLAEALFTGDHSTELQDYIIDDVLPYVTTVSAGDVSFSPVVPHGEILPQVWESLEIEVASSIQAVAAKLGNVVDAMPGKQGQMLFKSMAVLNAKRPTIGDHKATIHHQRQQENLVILDVSGSMTERTIRTIVDDVVALSYTANAHLAIVSNTCTYWLPGTYGTDEVLASAEFGGTYYEELTPLFDRDWGVVVTIADYDSSPAAKAALAACTGRISEVMDISLVNQPTYLAECVGQLASKVTPMLVGQTYNVLS